MVAEWCGHCQPTISNPAPTCPASLSRVRHIGSDQVQDSRVSRSGRIATDQKAVRRRGPGRVVLGSKPQLATTKKLVRWAGEQAAACDYQITRALGYTRRLL